MSLNQSQHDPDEIVFVEYATYIGDLDEEALQGEMEEIILIIFEERKGDTFGSDRLAEAERKLMMLEERLSVCNPNKYPDTKENDGYETLVTISEW